MKVLLLSNAALYPKGIELFKGSQASPLYPSDKKRTVSMECWWSVIDKGKTEYWERNLFHCHFVYHKSHID
jgi:hypothetical protein